ncbi:MAG: hypothetical protein IT384_20590 [Deltaproteobacteria bacterium]|nr:hypothetical protein [Deltaproteobacteria bacterium]
MESRSFRASLTLTLAEDDKIDGTWEGLGDFSSWAGRVRGMLDTDAELACEGSEVRALCVDVTRPGGLARVGLLEGSLDGGGGSGTWAFRATDSEYNGSGSWAVRLQ